ncbi:DUF3108 domain-containing protein [Spongiivirga sp. MCCC 1A20706]|uniref:DUF3108 domain-containing protein n=1 Tax=Spongiivirga sp. MCCC 1A20706 TaxID=3160963 RepID=UPI003977A935
MMKYLLPLLLIFTFFFGSAQEKQSCFKEGEWFKFRIHYGLINAGYATMEVKKETLDEVPVYHVVGYGRTTGLSRLFFRVEDNYESYFDQSKLIPYKFVRKIDEGGHTKDKEIFFDHDARQAVVKDYKHDTEGKFDIQSGVQDMISAFYYLRANYKVDELRVGDELALNMFFDEETFPFKLKYLGKETIRTKFGKIRALKFRPIVQAGRVFKEKESVTLWVSNDDNKVPLRIKASLAVGSLKADLDAFKGLKHSFKVIVN